MSANDQIALRRNIESSMAAAIKRGTGAIVTVFVMAQPGQFCVSGDPRQVELSRTVMQMTGAELIDSQYDEELEEHFDYWRKI